MPFIGNKNHNSYDLIFILGVFFLISSLALLLYLTCDWSYNMQVPKTCMAMISTHNRVLE